MITDGGKGGRERADGVYIADDGQYVEIGQGRQYVQVDLQENSVIDAVWIWHRHPYEGYEVPLDVVVQVANDASFAAPATMVFNSDADDSLGLGRGSDRRYATSRFGKLILTAGALGRHVRLWFSGGTRTNNNTLVEVEVYGRTTALIRQQEADRSHALRRERVWRWFLIIATAAISSIALVILLRRARERKRGDSLVDES